MDDKDLRWFEEYRLEWITETLRIFGYINRDHVVRKFRISKAQAAHDFKQLQALDPGLMEYDKNAKRYVYLSKPERHVRRIRETE